MSRTALLPVIMLLVNVVLGSIGQLLLKYGSSRLSPVAGQGIGASLVGSFKGIFTPYIFLGFCIYGVSSIIWIRILRQVNLSFAYPMVSLSYVLVVLLSALIFREKVPWPTAVGLGLICMGVSLIGIGYANRSWP
ncbi:MAG: DMT family transporter [Armatimonadota bacterium]